MQDTSAAPFLFFAFREGIRALKWLPGQWHVGIWLWGVQWIKRCCLGTKGTAGPVPRGAGSEPENCRREVLLGTIGWRDGELRGSPNRGQFYREFQMESSLRRVGFVPHINQ